MALLAEKERQLKEVEEFKRNREALKAENEELEELLAAQKELRVKENERKDAEKLRATDKLKKEMLEKIQITKTELFALKKEQLESKTRLTVLQNYQLTTELEYQSKQTEKLFFKNQKLIEQVKALKRDVEIHKQVETELAKRSHFSDKLTTKLKKRLLQMEEECQELRAEIQNNKANLAAARIGNEQKERRLALMSDDLATFEQNLALAKNVGCPQQDHAASKAERDRLAEKYNDDLRRLRFLSCLVSRTLQIGPGRAAANQAEGAASLRADGRKREFADLDSRERELLLAKLLKLLDGQLEVGGGEQRVDLN